MAPHAGFDTEQVREKARKDLLYLLEGVRGKKNLVIEQSLAGPLGVIVKASTLRDYGVDNFFFLENKNTDSSQRNVVFIARGESARHAHTIADQIRRLQRDSQSPHEFHIFWVPRRTVLSDKVLEEAGVLGDANIAELPLYFFPLEKDLLSLELETSFKDLYLAKDPTSIFLLSKALMGIQQRHGLFPRIIGKGDNAKRVAELLARMRQELLAGEDVNETDKTGLTPSTTTESVIIIDREVDFVTPLLTQLTYEGLIDEVFGIQNNQTEVDSTIVGAAAPAAPGASGAAAASSPQTRKRKVQLDGSDKLFEQVRDENFAIVGNLLNKIALRLKSDYESRHSSKTTADLKVFMQKLPGYQAEQQSLKIHTGLTEEIMKHTKAESFNKLLEVQQNLAAGADPSSQFEAIEELIARDTPLPEVLRLLCIYSCISGGIKSREMDHFRRLILQGYGYQHLLTLHNLERLQMFLPRSSPLASMIPMSGGAGGVGTKTNYTYLRKQLRLIVDEVNERDPNDIAYVYSGYAPLSIRLVQCILQKQYLLSITRGNGATSAPGPAATGAQGWRGFDEAVKHARGATFDEVQKGEDKAVRARALLSGNGEKKTVFVVFVGGISFTEIAALRFIAKQEQAKRNIVICTTSIISGNKMMDAAIEKETESPDSAQPRMDDVEAADPRYHNDSSSEEIAPEIVVWTGNDNMAATEAIAQETDPITPVPPNPPIPPAAEAPAMTGFLHPDAAVEQGSSSVSSHSVVSDHSDLFDAPHSQTSKATTPVDIEASRGTNPQTPQSALKQPSISIPTDLPPADYAIECVAAAEASRLNPEHISHAQVTTYLNIRNGILRLWEAVGCAKDSRWFDVASVCFDWLVRRGFINFGKLSRQAGKQKTVVIIGAGMAGLGCARQLEGLFAQYSRKFRDMGEEPPRVVLLEGRNRIGGRVYSKMFRTKPTRPMEGFEDKRCTAEMGGMIITGFDRGNPLNILVRDTTLYDFNGKPVDLQRDQLVENLYNDCLDRVSEYKFKQPSSKLIEGNRDLMDEGKDSAAETHKTIKQSEEATAAQPHSLPVSEQNIAPHVNLVPISTDRATGRIHTEPGTPGALKAAHKAKLMGWSLKQGPATKEPNATLGSVTDAVIAQYKDLVDLTAQDYQYSNATNYHQLSLQGWDIDAGNEWEGSHTMVIGGYQSVPRGLLLIPTPLNLRPKSPVKKIVYTTEGSGGPAVVECEDGYRVEADFVVSTIPLGVLKHGNVEFEPPLPPWKSDSIRRLGFGVLNKVILVYKEPFWDEERDIFGVLRNPTNRNSLDQKDYASQRGRFFQWFNITKTSGLPALLALMAGDAGFDTEQACNDDLVAEATTILRSVYGDKVPYPVEAVITRWASDKFTRGSYSSAGPEMRADDYDTMAKPIGNLFFAGEHTSGTHPATVHGAYLSGLRAASEVLDAMLGAIEIPTPLIIPKESSLSLKRKAEENKDPMQAYEIELWDHIINEIGLRPLVPSKPATNAYIFYSKEHYDDAKRKLEEGRRAGKGKASANEVRVMSAKMWRDASEEVRRPYVEMAEEQKRVHAAAMAEFKLKADEWDRRATELKERYERDHPPPTEAGSGGAAEERRSKRRVASYAEESEGSDVEMG
ncbi:Sec1-like protein [Echria macrotheca]|uniref:Sec1-like protein n=1 Tax=Echria macrotheca TaxID=438768 RepID=A0AAJ0F8P7_9PEZI|nr:Sec1-like protein [Echria macrotheca]